MASRRQRIIQALADRLRVIQVANGFGTDAGLLTFLGEVPTFGPDDPDVAIALAVGDSETGGRVEAMTLLPIEIQALAKADISAPLLSIEATITDIRKAVELEDRSLGGECKQLTRGPVRALPRESGMDVVGAGVEYRALYGEKWGDPEL